jgi:hypothetical protein
MVRLRSALESFVAMGVRSFIADTQVRVAEALVAAGDALGALRVLDEASESGLPTTEPTARRVAGWAHLQLGDHERAVASFASGIADARATGALFELAWCLRGLALTADDAAAEEESRRVQEQLGVRALPAVPMPI